MDKFKSLLKTWWFWVSVVFIILFIAALVPSAVDQAPSPQLVLSGDDRDDASDEPVDSGQSTTPSDEQELALRDAEALIAALGQDSTRDELKSAQTAFYELPEELQSADAQAALTRVQSDIDAREQEALRVQAILDTAQDLSSRIMALTGDQAADRATVDALCAEYEQLDQEHRDAVSADATDKLELMLAVHDEPEPDPEPDPVASTGEVVISATGTKYHLETCHTLKKQGTWATVAEAKARGYEACKVCKPPQ